MGGVTERRNFPSPFRRLLVTDYYDGATAGVAVDASGALFVFRLLDWDDGQDRRVFSFATVPSLKTADAERAFGPAGPGGPETLVLPVPLSEEGEAFLKACEASGRVVAVVVAEDLLGTLDLWLPVAAEPALQASEEWLERLGFPRER